MKMLGDWSEEFDCNREERCDRESGKESSIEEDALDERSSRVRRGSVELGIFFGGVFV